MKQAIILSLLALLAACHHTAKGRAMTAQEKSCLAMKRQMEFNRVNNNLEARWIAPSQHAKLREMYYEYGCDKG